MKKTALLSMLLLLAACQQYDVADIMDGSQPPTAKSRNLSTIENYISKTRGKKTRAATTNIIPYIVNGDTVMFVANYPEGGFEIFSNDTRLPMVLAKSKTDSYYPNHLGQLSPFEEYMKDTAEKLQSIGVDSSSEPEDESLWSVYSIRDGSCSGGGDDGKVYQEVGIALESYSKEWTPAGGRLSTKWDQEGNYNQYTPLLIDGTGSHSPLGCGAVAAGQYLFHSHNYFNSPTTTFTEAQYIASTNSYNFSSNNSSSWHLIDDGSDLTIKNDKERMKPTAIFLGYVARGVKTVFGKKQGDTSDSNTKLMTEFINNSCSLNLDFHHFDFLKIKEILSSGRPVYTSLFGNLSRSEMAFFDELIGHYCIIDYALAISETYYRIFAYVPQGNETPEIDQEEDPDSCENNLEYYRNKYGEIYSEFLETNHSSWVSINWGLGGKHDDMLINAEMEEWILFNSDSSQIFYTHFIYY